MPSQPETVNDTVLYQLRNFYGDQNITVRMLDGSILDIWGPVFVNGNALTLIGALPIASNAEALAGTDNTKVMTPLRVREAGDARYLKLTGGTLSSGLIITEGNLSLYDGTLTIFIGDLDMLGGHINADGDVNVAGLLRAYNNAVVGGYLTVADEIYGVGWNGSTQVPTKNAIYDKIESLSTGLTQEQIEDIVAALFAAGTHTNATVTYNDTTPSLSIAASGGGATVSDAVYGVAWNGDTTNAPSKNAVYDKIQTLPTALLPADGVYGDITVVTAGTSWQISNGVVDTLEMANNGVNNAKLADMVTARIKGRVTGSTGDPEDLTPAQARTVIASDSGGGTTNFFRADGTFAAPPGGGGASISDTVYGAGWDGDTTNGASKNAIYDKVEALDGLVVHKAGTESIAGAKNFNSTISVNGIATFNNVIVDVAMQANGPVSVPDDAYASGWNASTEVPTKNAVYDKIETLVTQSINAQTGTTYTLVLADAGKLVTLSNASAITLTVPTNTSVAYPTGTHIDLAQLGAGQVTVAPAGGVTVNATPTLKFRAQYSGASLVKYATDTWLLVGDLATT